MRLLLRRSTTACAPACSSTHGNPTRSSPSSRSAARHHVTSSPPIATSPVAITRRCSALEPLTAVAHQQHLHLSRRGAPTLLLARPQRHLQHLDLSAQSAITSPAGMTTAPDASGRPRHRQLAGPATTPALDTTRAPSRPHGNQTPRPAAAKQPFSSRRTRLELSSRHDLSAFAARFTATRSTSPQQPPRPRAWPPSPPTRHDRCGLRKPHRSTRPHATTSPARATRPPASPASTRPFNSPRALGFNPPASHRRPQPLIALVLRAPSRLDLPTRRLRSRPPTPALLPASA